MTLFRRCLATTLKSTGLLSVLQKYAKGRCVVFAYGRVTPGDPLDDGVYLSDAAISKDVFQKHMETLAAKFNVVTLEEAVRRFVTGEGFDEATAVVTLDGAWADNLQTALPIVAALRLPATLFIAPEQAESDKPLFDERAAFAAVAVWKRRDELVRAYPDEHMPARAKFIESLLLANPAPLVLADLIAKRLQTMDPSDIEPVVGFLECLAQTEGPPNAFASWDELADAVNGFPADIGCLGLSPRILGKAVTDPEEAKHRIEAETGRPVRVYAYADGARDPSLQSKIARAGFVAAVTKRPDFLEAADNAWGIGRIPLYEGKANSPSPFVCLTLWPEYVRD